MRGCGEADGTDRIGVPHPAQWGVSEQEAAGWGRAVFLALDGRRGVSPDLIIVINMPFEARETAQSCGRGAQITGWVWGGGWHGVCALVKSMSQWVRHGERQRAERDRRKRRETK